MSEIEAWTVELTRLADTAAAAVRAINHAAITGTALPAPCVYEVLGAAKRIGYGLEQATAQLAARLAYSAAVFIPTAGTQGPGQPPSERAGRAGRRA